MTPDLAGLLESAGVEQLYENGNELTGTCPFHDDTSPSFGMNQETGLWNCFACGASGNLDMFVSRAFNVEIGEASAKYHRFLGWPSLPERKERGVAVLDERTIAPYAALCPRYMLQRDFSKGFLREFEIGYDAEDNRVVFPIRDYEGKLVGITSRATFEGQDPKYKHSEFEKSDHLYLLHRTETTGDTLVLVEGHVDTIRMWQLRAQLQKAMRWRRLRFAGAGGIMGAHISKRQARLIGLMGIDNVVLALDNDAAGEKGLEVAVPRLLTKGVRSVYQLIYAEKDPGEMRVGSTMGLRRL